MLLIKTSEHLWEASEGSDTLIGLVEMFIVTILELLGSYIQILHVQPHFSDDWNDFNTFNP